MESPLGQVPESLKSRDSIDAAAPSSTQGFAFDSLAGFDYPQYPPEEALGMTSIHPTPRLGFPNLNLAAPMAEFTYGRSGHPYSDVYSDYSALPSLVDPFDFTSLSAGQASNDSSSGRHTRGSGSHSCDTSSVPRSVRYNPIGDSRSGRERKRRSSKNDDFSDNGDGPAPASAPTASNEVCGEETRRRRTELEQRRRDELRDSYRRLKGAVSDQKPDQKPTFSKASLLDCATTYIKCLETRLQEAENETARLRQVNETLMQGTAEQHHATATASMTAVEQQQSGHLSEQSSLEVS